MKWITDIRLKLIPGLLLMAGTLHLQSAFTQPRTLSISSIVQLEPILINDTTDFRLVLGVHHSVTMVPDSIMGDLFYYYQTDSMINSSTPPRVIDNSFGNQWIVDQQVDTLSIDIRPEEIRTGPINLIVVWPAMHNPNVSDSSGIAYYTYSNGYMGEEGMMNIPPKSNIIFPCPAFQFMYIKTSEMPQIRQIDILGINGSIIATYTPQEFNGGYIYLKDLPPGTYVVNIYYFDKRVVQTRLLKY
jgi:hypothetical protein